MRNFLLFVSFTFIAFLLIPVTQAEASWSAKTAAGARNWNSATISADGSKMAAAPLSGYIYISLDGGDTWQANTNAGSRAWRALSFSPDGSKLVAAADNDYIYISNDDGASWNIVTELSIGLDTESGIKRWTSLTMSNNGQKIFASAYAPSPGEYIYFSNDFGITWARLDNSQVTIWESISSSLDGNNLIAAGNSQGYVSTTSGATWNISLPNIPYLKSVVSSANGLKLAVSSAHVTDPTRGYIYTSIDGGANWIQRTSAGNRHWWNITSTSDGNKIFAVDDYGEDYFGGYIYYSADGGETWAPQTAAGARAWTAIESSSDGKKVIAVSNLTSVGWNPDYIYVYTAPNTVPTVSNVNISGDNYVGQVLIGDYSYSDAENDLEGTSTFRWLRNGAPISGATSATYETSFLDLGNIIRFEVRPVAQSGATPGTAVLSEEILIVRPEPEEIELSSPDVILSLTQLSATSTSINIPDTVPNPTLNLLALAQASEESTAVTIPQEISINATTTLGQVRVSIPAGITITAPTSTWDAIIDLPQARDTASINLANSTVLSAIKIGDSDVGLTFDKAIKLVFSGYAGKRIGYYDSANAFHAITETCTENSQDWTDANLSEAGDCKIDDDNDLVVWTKHFTEFVVYEDTPPTVNEPRTIASAPPVPACTAVTYSDWQPCQAGFNIQFRTIASQSPESCSLTVLQRQLMERSCSSEQTSEQDGENGTSSEDSSALKDSVLSRERTLTTKINTTLSSRLSGRILLQVEEKGEAWYLNPLNNLRYYLGRPADAFNLMRSLGLGATTQDISSFLKNTAPKRLSGRILLQVEDKGQAYYVNPLTLKLHYLGRPDDAFNLMRSLGLGISNINVRQIGLEE